jgi:phytanoyl-CoA hydroxylase
MMDRSEYNENGFVLRKGFFTHDEVEAVRREAKDIFLAQMRRHGLVASGELSDSEFEQGMFRLFETDLPSFVNSGKQAQHLISLHRLSLDERLVSSLRELGLTTPNISTRPLFYFNSRRLAKKEVYWRLSVHQDWRSMQGSLDSIVVWVALVDINRALGALEVVPGSHKWGLLDSEMADGYGHIDETMGEKDFAAMEVEAGDALFFSSFLVHKSGTSATDAIRWSCHFRYNNLAEPTFVERGFAHPYIYKPQDELITPGFPRKDQVESIFKRP